MKRYFLVFVLMAIISGCTSISVNQINKSHNIQHVCLEENKKVIVNGFVQVIEDGFQNHQITTEVYSGPRPRHCIYKLTYTALRSWDFTPYLSHAELHLYKNNSKIGYAEYHLNGKGGFSLMKWASVKSKMTPVINELLAQYK